MPFHSATTAAQNQGMTKLHKPQSEWLSIEQLASELGVPLATVHAWNYKGTAPRRVRVGKHVRYRREDVDRWLAEHTIEAGHHQAEREQ